MNESNIFENSREINAASFLAEYSRAADMWVGCSDCSFSPADFKGKHSESFLFHQNVGNLVPQTDINCLAAMQFAVKVCEAENIFVCGHYDCRIIAAVLDKDEKNLNFLGDWLNPVRRLAEEYEILLEDLPAENQIEILCRLNVIEQVFNAGCSTAVREAWRRGQKLNLRAVVFQAKNNSFTDLDFFAEDFDSLVSRYDSLKKRLMRRGG